MFIKNIIYLILVFKLFFIKKYQKSNMAEHDSNTSVIVDPSESVRLEELKSKKRQRKPRPRLDPLKYELLQGDFPVLQYKSLRHIYADRSTHGLRRHQIKSLKVIMRENSEQPSRLGSLRLRTKKERQIKI